MEVSHIPLHLLKHTCLFYKSRVILVQQQCRQQTVSSFVTNWVASCTSARTEEMKILIIIALLGVFCTVSVHGSCLDCTTQHCGRCTLQCTVLNFNCVKCLLMHCTQCINQCLVSSSVYVRLSTRGSKWIDCYLSFPATSVRNNVQCDKHLLAPY